MSIIDTRREQMLPKLSPREIDRLRRFGEVRRYAAGQLLFVTGEVCPGMFVLLAGSTALGVRRQRDNHNHPFSARPRGSQGPKVAVAAGTPSSPHLTLSCTCRAAASVLTVARRLGGALTRINFPAGGTLPGERTLPKMERAVHGRAIPASACSFKQSEPTGIGAFGVVIPRRQDVGSLCRRSAATPVTTAPSVQSSTTCR